MGVKIAVVGGGSTYTPELVEGFARPRATGCRSTSSSSSTSTPSGSRSSAASPSGCSSALGWPGRLDPDRRPRRRASTAPTSSSSSSGSAARRPGSSTRRCPRGSASIGQETTGAGGFAKALRTVPVVLELAERGRPARGARAPGSSTSRTRSASSPRRCSTTGIGRSACATSRSASSAGSPRASASSPERVELEHVGLNHLTLGAGGPGRRRRPPARAARRGRRRDSPSDVGLPVDLVRALGAIPSYYLRYYYLTRDGPRRAARTATTRGRGGHGHRARLLELYRDPTLDEKPALLADRGGAFYSEAAAQLIASLHDGARRRPGRRRPQRRRAAGPARRRRRRDPGADRSRRRPSARRWRRSRPSMRGLVQAVKALRGARDPRPRRAATGGPRCARSSPTRSSAAEVARAAARRPARGERGVTCRASRADRRRAEPDGGRHARRAVDIRPPRLRRSPPPRIVILPDDRAMLWRDAPLPESARPRDEHPRPTTRQPRRPSAPAAVDARHGRDRHLVPARRRRAASIAAVVGRRRVRRPDHGLDDPTKLTDLPSRAVGHLRPDRQDRARPVRRRPARRRHLRRDPADRSSTPRPRSRTRRSGRTPASTRSRSSRPASTASAAAAAAPRRSPSSSSAQRLLDRRPRPGPAPDRRAQAQGDHPVDPADRRPSRATRASSRSSPPT